MLVGIVIVLIVSGFRFPLCNKDAMHEQVGDVSIVPEQPYLTSKRERILQRRCAAHYYS